MYVDNAVDRILGPCFLSYTAEPCQDTCNGSALYGLQSGLLSLKLTQTLFITFKNQTIIY